LDSINNGDKTFEEAALSESKDSSAAANGKIGNLYFFQIQSNFKNPDDAQQLFAAEVGKPIGPVEGTSSWTIYRVNAAPSNRLHRSHVACHGEDLHVPV
jgi:parvulin-like peptidyl-prolyl isomerase